ncbi:MAG: hypothetical protein ACI83D_000224 [Planctomycetota bacterium]|jgi:hypothetical protein
MQLQRTYTTFTAVIIAILIALTVGFIPSMSEAQYSNSNYYGGGYGSPNNYQNGYYGNNNGWAPSQQNRGYSNLFIPQVRYDTDYSYANYNPYGGSNSGYGGYGYTQNYGNGYNNNGWGYGNNNANTYYGGNSYGGYNNDCFYSEYGNVCW